MTSGNAFEEAVKPLLRELRQYCVYLTGSTWDGEDLLQETVALAFRYYKRRGEIKEIRPFLMKVARNKRIDGYRKRRIRETSGDLALEEGRRDSCYFEIKGWIEWLAAKLPANQLKVWLLADYFGYTMNEIAQGLGYTMSAVRSLLFRAREKLRSCRSGSDIEPGEINADTQRGTSAKHVSLNGMKILIERWANGIMKDDPQDLLLKAARTGS
jgi:RNA polymerase sigma-70 factor (ECF subfamily)